MANTPTNTTGTTRLAAKKILDSARRVKDRWETNAELFTGYKLSKTDFDTILTEGAAVEVAYADLAATEDVVRARLDEEYKAEIAAAKQKRDARIAELKQSKAVAAEERQKKLVTLSRAAQGAKLFAQSSALSDEVTENDVLVKDL